MNIKKILNMYLKSLSEKNQFCYFPSSIFQKFSKVSVEKETAVPDLLHCCAALMYQNPNEFHHIKYLCPINA